MIYVDASVLVAALVLEVNTERALAWISARPGGVLCISGWVATEVSSALALKMRIGALTADRRTAILSVWQELRSASLSTVPVPQDAFTLAADMIDDPGSTLRAGDALHLAIASLGGHSLATLDARLAEAALRVGVPVETIA